MNISRVWVGFVFSEKAKSSAPPPPPLLPNNPPTHMVQHQQYAKALSYLRTHTPRRCEHDPKEIIRNVNTCIDQVSEKLNEMGLSTSDIKGIGITNQRETTGVCESMRQCVCVCVCVCV